MCPEKRKSLKSLPIGSPGVERATEVCVNVRELCYGMSRPAWNKSGAALRTAQPDGRRSAASAPPTGLDFAGNGARRYEDIGGGGEPIGLMVM